MRVVPRTGRNPGPAPPRHWTRLTHARLTHARLTHARLTHARLTYADALHGRSGRLGNWAGPNVFAGCGRNTRRRPITAARPERDTRMDPDVGVDQPP
ncbi:pentapeptide repeat-containing protein [Nocardia sp. NPDC058499]|uniref:pentapeptide repeat-containing protein n=1 Tax=Nocardia sp. NPDC058499 TaxID=3346530 RepID=UPI00365636B8